MADTNSWEMLDIDELIVGEAKNVIAAKGAVKKPKTMDSASNTFPGTLKSLPNPPALMSESFMLVTKPDTVSLAKPKGVAVAKIGDDEVRGEGEEVKEGEGVEEEEEEEKEEPIGTPLFIPRRLLTVLALVFILVASERYVNGMGTIVTSVESSLSSDLALVEVVDFGDERVEEVGADEASKKVALILKDQSTQTMTVREEIYRSLSVYYTVYINIISTVVLRLQDFILTSPAIKEGYEFLAESEICKVGERTLVLAGTKAVVLYKDSIKPGIEEIYVSASDFNTNVVQPGIVSASEFNTNVITPTLEPMLNIITEFAEDVAAPTFKQLMVRGGNAIAKTAEFAKEEVMPALKVMGARGMEFSEDVVVPALNQLASKSAEIAEEDVIPAIRSFSEDIAKPALKEIALQGNGALQNYVKPGLKELGRGLGKHCGTAIATTSLKTEAFRKSVVAPALKKMEKRRLSLGTMFWEFEQNVVNSTTVGRG